ncbi:MAG: right-handed parallel beta-helix repeat-containing protein [Kofleriaceae bacterium]|nr:right-handed parallel beta-helix repeat-containing protein [Kofleriaceae bacterium]
MAFFPMMPIVMALLLAGPPLSPGVMARRLAIRWGSRCAAKVRSPRGGACLDRLALVALVVGVAGVVLACSAPACPASPDATAPGSRSDGGDPSSRSLRVAPPALTECLPGWQLEAGGAYCEPWASDVEPCPEGQVRTPGDQGCRLVGSPCPDGPFPTDVPRGTSTLFVMPGAAAGGDGSQAAPFARIADAVTRSSAGTIIVLAKGRYDESVDLPRGVTLRGACTAETVLTNSSARRNGTITVYAPETRIENLRIVGGLSAGLWVNGEDGSADVTLSGVVVEEAFLFGIAAAYGAVVNGDDVVVRRTRERPSTRADSYGLGVIVSDNGRVSLGRAVLERNYTGALAIRNGELVLRRAVIREQVVSSAGRFGYGLAIQSRARVAASESVIERNVSAAVEVSEGRFEGRALVVRNTAHRPSDSQLGYGFNLDDAELHLNQVAIDLNGTAALIGRGPGLDVTIEDAWLGRTRYAFGYFGAGMVVDDGMVRLSRVRVTDNSGHGLLFRAGAQVSLADVEVRATGSELDTGEFGRGIEAIDGARIVGERVRIEANRDVGLAAFAGSMVALSDVEVLDTAERGCVSTLCPGYGAGVGVLANAATVQLERFVIARSALVGAQVVDGELTLRDGEVRDNPIGVNLDRADYDVSRISEEVRYTGNERNLATDSSIGTPAPSSLPDLP